MQQVAMSNQGRSLKNLSSVTLDIRYKVEWRISQGKIDAMIT